MYKPQRVSLNIIQFLLQLFLYQSYNFWSRLIYDYFLTRIIPMTTFVVICGQWWILGEANEAVASGPPFFGGPPLENSIYSFGFAQWTIRSEDFFFLENTLILGEKYPSPDQTSFFSDNRNF